MELVALRSDLVTPFVYAACRRYNIAYDPDSGDDVIWWAGIDTARRVRAAAGWSEGADGDIVLTGPFGDGSHVEEVWMNELLRAMAPVNVRFVVIPASPSLFLRRQSAQLERYGMFRAPQTARKAS